MANAQLQDVFENLVEAVDGFTMELLPNNVNVNHGPNNNPNGSLYNSSLSFFVSPQDNSTKAVMENFNNKDVVVLVHKNNSVHVYGTKQQPLRFSYSEVNGNSPGSLKGFTALISGQSTDPSIYMESSNIVVINKGLAFTLARQL